MQKRIKVKDTRGVEHLIDPEQVETFTAARCTLNRACVEVIVNGETIFADCSFGDFMTMFNLACA